MKTTKLLTTLASTSAMVFPIVNITSSCSHQTKSEIVISSDKEKNQRTTTSDVVVDIIVNTNLSDIVWNINVDSSKDASGQDEIVFDQATKKITAKKNSMGVIKLYASSKNGESNSNILEFWFCDEFKFVLVDKITTTQGPLARLIFNLDDYPDYDGPVIILPTMYDAHVSSMPVLYTIDDINFHDKLGRLPIKRVYIDDEISNIASGTFTNCFKLEYVRWPKNTTIVRGSTFAMCQSLVQVDNLDSVIEIQADVFRACYKLTDITLPSGLTSIGNDAFRLCTSLKKIHIPKTLSFIDETAYDCCDSLEDITVDPLNETYTSYDANCVCKKGEHTILIGGHKTQLDNPNINAIGPRAFSGRSFENIVIPSNIQKIEKFAFSYCEKLKYVKIPDSVLSIGNGIFYGCTKLINIDWSGKSLNEIPNYMFYGTLALTDYTVPSNITKIGDCAFSYSGLQNITLHDNITSIGSYAFDHSQLTSLELPSSITEIPRCMCWEANALENVTFKGNILSIQDAAFDSCGFETISIPNSCETIEGGAFNRCTSLKSMDLSNTKVTSINNSVFAFCNSLKNIKLNVNTTKLGNYAFESCESITELDLSTLTKLTKIGDFCFKSCSNMNKIVLPNSITEIGTSAFYDCTELNSDNINIPTSLQIIKSNAFAGCGYITSFVAPSTLTTIEDNAFDQTGLDEFDLSAFETADSIPTVGTGVFSRIQEGKIKFLVKDATMLNNFKTSSKGWTNYLDENKFSWEVKS